MRYHITAASTNKKTGSIPVVTSSRDTCPPSCPLQGAGCYAEYGPLRIHWDKVSSGERSISLEDLCVTHIRRLPRDSVWRWAQAGDLPGEGDSIDEDNMQLLVKSNAGRRVIAYTHKPPVNNNLRVLKDAISNGFPVNLSANDLAHADNLKRTGLPVVTILAEEYARKTTKGNWSETISEYRERTETLPKTTPKGHRIAVCPATYTDTTCKACGVCADPIRNGVVVGFPAHGSKKRTLSEGLRTLKQMRNVSTPGELYVKKPTRMPPSRDRSVGDPARASL